MKLTAKQKRKIQHYGGILTIVLFVFGVLMFFGGLAYLALDFITSVIGWLDRN